jgi:hypothetical protein
VARLIRGVYESEGFKEQKEKIGDAYEIDKVLDGIYWAVASNAEMYPIVPDTNRTRMIFTHEFVRLGTTLPPLRVYFAIEDENNAVLLWIEEDD